MGKVTKATKKFQKKHLGRELTKRKHDQKKKQIREKSLAKYAPKEGEGSGEEEGEDEAADESEVFNTKAKSNPGKVNKPSSAPAASSKPASFTSSRVASKKAPQIDDLEVDQFMDGSFLEDDDADQDDGDALDDEDEEEEEEEEEAGEDDEEMADGDDDDENAQLLAEIEAHEAELKNLSKTDPEFFKHLQREDKDLLKFSKEEFDQEEEDEEEADAGLSDEEGAPEEQEVLTMESLAALKKQVCPPVLSLKALKRFVRIFRGAVHIGAVTDAKTKGDLKRTQSEEAAAKEAAFRQEVAIHSPKVFQELIRFSLKELTTQVWNSYFKPAKGKKDDSASGSATALDKQPKWSSAGPVLKAFLGHLLFFLGTLRSNPNGRMARFVLSAMEGLIRFFEPFPKLAQKLLKELLELWATSEHNVRIDAFLRIRQLAIELTSSGNTRGSGENMLELTLKGIYLTYVRHSKFTSMLNMPVIEFMANCVVEIYGIDPSLSYQHAFVYIRQLAIHLRQALQAKKKDSHRMVYNWNFINCCRVWSKILSVHGKATTNSAGTNGQVAQADNLHSLVYPFVQICLSTLTVLPSSRYFPLRFHVCRFLIDLSANVKIFIPLASHLLGVFQSSELSKKPSSSTRKVNDIAFVLKASQLVINTKAYQENVIDQALRLLLEYFNLYSYSIGYNELILPTIKFLKKQSKELLIHRVRKQITNFILKLEHNATWIATKRNACNYAPKDLMDNKNGVDAIDSFRPAAVQLGNKPMPANQQSPLDKYVSLQIAERKALDESKADWDGSKGSRKEPKKKKGQDSDEEDEERPQKPGRRDEQDDGEDDEMDYDDEEGEDDEGEDYDDDDGDDDEDQPRKKSKSNNAESRKPFEYPSDEEDDAADGDQLEELNFSDDEDSAPKTKSKKQNQKSANKQANNGKHQTPQKSGDKRKRA